MLNQITACTGQPILATNVTQAQAFCIATACLQVPVFVRFVANSPNERQSANKLNLFKPSLLFGAFDKHSKWANSAYHQNDLLPSQHRQFFPSGFPLKYPTRNKLHRKLEGDDKSHWLESLLKEKGVNYFRLVVNSPRNTDQEALISSEFNSASLNETLALPETKPPESASTTEAAVVSSTGQKVEETTTTQLPTTTKLPEPVSEPSPIPPREQQPTSMATEETRLSYPNFNRMYSQIYNEHHYRPLLYPVSSPPLLSLFYPFTWRPYEALEKSSSNRRQQQQIRWAAGQMANLMRTVSNNLTVKKIHLINLWQNLSNSNSQNTHSKLPLKLL